MQQIVITKKGLELIAKAVGSTSNITFTRLETSDMDYSNVVLEDLTELQDVQQSVNVANVTVVDKAQVEVIGAFDNKEVEVGYYVKALGIYAKSDNEEEVLYGVSIELQKPDYMPPFLNETVSGISYRLYIKVENSDNVTLEVDSATVPTMIQVQDLEERTIYIEENMITPTEKTAIQRIVNDGVSIKELRDVEVDEFQKPTMPIVTTQGILKNFDVFDIETKNSNVLEASVLSFQGTDKSYSEDVVTFNSGVGGSFEVQDSGDIILSSNVEHMNIDLKENITFENKQGNKYITYVLQKLNGGVYEDLVVGDEVLKLANNDNNLSIEIHKRLVDESLVAGTYRILRKYRNDKSMGTYVVDSGSILLYSDVTMEAVRFKEKYIPDIYKLGNVPLSGAFKNTPYIPQVNGNGGTIEIGKYIDFHLPDSKKDYDGRFEISTTGYPFFNGNPMALRNGILQTGLNSEKLNGLDTSKFGRTDIRSVFAKGLDAGSGIDAGVYFEGGNHVINNNDGGGNFNIRVGNIRTRGMTETGYGGHLTFAQDTGTWRINSTNTSQEIGETPNWANLLSVSNNGIFYKDGPIWHRGNDGVGSGLDADLLDGKEATDFAPNGYGVGGVAKTVSNTSWNNYVVGGMYQGYGMSNRPPYTKKVHEWDYCKIIQHSSKYCLQTVSDFANTETWQRVKVNERWSAWKQIMLDGTSNSTRFGYNVLTKDTSGVGNTAIGASTLCNNTTGIYNMGVGFHALVRNIGGSYNIAIGNGALRDVVDANNNTVLGMYAGMTLYNGGEINDCNDATFIGYHAKPLNNNSINEIVIGCGSTGYGSNTAHIGNGNIGTISYGAGTGTNFTNRSDERLKEDIELANIDLCYDNIVKKLPVKRFKYKDDYVQEEDTYKIGFIAQDFEKVLPKAVHKSKAVLHKLDENGNKLKKQLIEKRTRINKNENEEEVEEVYDEVIEVDDTYLTDEDMLSIDVTQLLPMTIGAMQKLAKRVDELEEEILKLKGGL